MFSKVRFFSFLLVCFSSQVFSSIDDYLPLTTGPTSSNYGETGLYEMPTARFQEAGNLKFGFSSFYPYEVTSISGSPFSWMEATFRYNEIKNQLYSPYSFYSGNQTLKDKGFDFKIRLLKESRFLPAIAVGLRDLAGTGLFASEYVVGTKRFGNLDTTIGIGWGQMGRESNISNPLARLSDKFSSRSDGFGEGGSFQYSSWFSGDRAALFAGLEYTIPGTHYSFLLEYDTSNAADPTPGTLERLDVDSKFNFGITRPVGKFLDLKFGYIRGNVFQFAFSLKGDYGERGMVPKIDKPPGLIKLGEKEKKLVQNKELLYKSLLRNLSKERIYLQSATKKDNKLELTINQNRFTNFVRATGRTARIAASLSPEDVDVIDITHMVSNAELATVSLRKDDLIKAVNKKVSSEEVYENTVMFSPKSSHFSESEFIPDVTLPDFSWNIQPALKSHIGGPEAFFLGQAWLKVNSLLILKRGLSLSTVLGIGLYDNFDQLNNPSYGTIPHVRSDIQDYLREGRNNLVRMKLDYVWSPFKDVIAKVDFGLYEEMFGGVGGEVLYRPFGSRYAIGVSGHKLKQRDFDQRFTFRDYKVKSGFVNFYYDMPNGVNVALSTGQYLAGDRGATLDLSRRFKSGFRLGVFATITNVSAEEFGEGSFDKGFYFSLPVELFTSTFQPGEIAFGLHPSTKDGGQMLYNTNPLIGIIGNTNEYELRRDWDGLLD